MLPLFRHLGVAAFGKVRPTATRLTRSLIGGAVAGIFGLTAYVALLLALGFYLSAELGAVYAALIVALLTAVCAVIVLMVVQVLTGVPAMMRGRSLLTTAAIAALVFGVAKMQGVGRDDHDDWL